MGNYYYAGVNVPSPPKSKVVLNTVHILVALYAISGAVGSVLLAWSFTDTLSALMAIINIVVVLPLDGIVVALL